jgi:hypothetical protein
MKVLIPQYLPQLTGVCIIRHVLLWPMSSICAFQYLSQQHCFLPVELMWGVRCHIESATAYIQASHCRHRKMRLILHLGQSSWVRGQGTSPCSPRATMLPRSITRSATGVEHSMGLFAFYCHIKRNQYGFMSEDQVLRKVPSGPICLALSSQMF